MIYVTARITEPYKQISLEDIMSALLQDKHVRESRSLYTRTVTYERLPERILAGFDTGKKIELLRAFNKKHQELLESAVIKKYLITANDGKSYSTKHYCHVLLSIVFQVYLFSGFQFFKCYG